MTLTIDPKRLKEIDWLDMPTGSGAPQFAYADRSRGVCVQVWQHATPGCNDTPWQGTLRVAVKRTSAKTREQADDRSLAIPITWDELQAIKDFFWPGRIAIEVYPPRTAVVNVADLRWLWVLPAGAVLPFNLQDASPEQLVS